MACIRFNFDFFLFQKSNEEFFYIIHIKGSRLPKFRERPILTFTIFMGIYESNPKMELVKKMVLFIRKFELISLGKRRISDSFIRNPVGFFNDSFNLYMTWAIKLYTYRFGKENKCESTPQIMILIKICSVFLASFCFVRRNRNKFAMRLKFAQHLQKMKNCNASQLNWNTKRKVNKHTN